jgi:muramidase (phage lysozyme)
VSRYAEALQHPNVQAFLHMIRVGEGTPDEDGYRRLFGGELVDSLTDHPRRAVTKKLGGKPITSTAAGAYQFLSRTWDGVQKALEKQGSRLPDFGPASQDIGAVFLIAGRKALDDVLAGRIEDAIRKCNREWASLPGSPYGQPVKTLAEALAAYRSAGGHGPDQEASPASPPPAPPTPKETTMAPAFLLTMLPQLISQIPSLVKLFKPEDEKTQKYADTAVKVFDIAKTAIGAVNEQELVETLEADPTAVQTVQKAVQDQWYTLVEAGGGGIDGARKADLAFVTASPGNWWDVLRSPSFFMACLLLPLVYLIVLSIIGVVGPVQWSDDVRAAIAGTIVGSIVGGLIGYYFGQTTTKNRTPAEAVS